MNNSTDRSSIISVINTPLGFFALALLIVEGFLGITIIGAGGSIGENVKLTGMWMATISFGVVILLVTIFVIFFPEHLMLSGKDWSKAMDKKNNWGTKKKPQIYSEINSEQDVQNPLIGKSEVEVGK